MASYRQSVITQLCRILTTSSSFLNWFKVKEIRRRFMLIDPQNSFLKSFLVLAKWKFFVEEFNNHLSAFLSRTGNLVILFYFREMQKPKSHKIWNNFSFELHLTSSFLLTICFRLILLFRGIFMFSKLINHELWVKKPSAFSLKISQDASRSSASKRISFSSVFQ